MAHTDKVNINMLYLAFKANWAFLKFTVVPLKTGYSGVCEWYSKVKYNLKRAL